jgi:hypothetical protein
MNELEKKLRGMHELVRHREAHARRLVASKTTTLDELRTFAECCIIDGADACHEFGPCPKCVENGDMELNPK